MIDFEPRFIFLGNAVGLAGQIRRPAENAQIIWAKGQSCLPVTGGYSRSESTCDDCSPAVMFDSVSTMASADFVDRDRAIARTFGQTDDQPIETLTQVNATVTNLTMLERVTVEHVEMNLTSRHDGSADEPHISPRGSVVTGMRLDGYLLDIEIDTDLFERFGTKAGFCDEYARNEDFREGYSSQLFRVARKDGDDDDDDDNKQVPVIGGYIVSTLVKKISWADEPHPNAKIENNRIYLPDYGRIYVAELLMSEGFKRLAMLRFQLGSPVGGDATAACGQTNGKRMP